MSSGGNRGRKRPLQPQGEEAPKRNRFPEFEHRQPGAGSSADAVGVDDDQYGDDPDMFDAANLPNDTMATVLALQKEFYSAAGKNSASGGRSGGERTGVVLQHQIYTVLENRTAVDLELTAMRKENVIRTFRLGTGREDWGVMTTQHYLRVISNLLGDSKGQDRHSDSRRSGSGGASRGRGDEGGSSSNCSRSTGSSSGSSRGASPTAAVPSSSHSGVATNSNSSFARDVLERLVLSNTKAYASQKQVSNAMRDVRKNPNGGANAGQGKGCTGGGGGAAAGAAVAGAGAAADESGRQQRIEKWEGGGDLKDLRSLKQSEDEVRSVTSKLIRAGFLLPRRDVGREEAYWFSMPQLGKVITAISRGRKDIVSALKRTRYKEIRRAAMEAKNPAKSTGLPLSFHLRDLLGLGMVRELETPSGMFIRLPSDAS